MRETAKLENCKKDAGARLMRALFAFHESFE
jgi:hypothetical protein